MKTLRDYEKKRDFSRTSEPRAKKIGSDKNLIFVVQKHAASHLHYDFRLELDGVLKSWAVPKGPSLDPADKRLAMMVEDHPLPYAKFEGRIPAGNYGAGTVEIWDKGIYSSQQTADRHESEKLVRRGLAEGNLKFILYGEKLKGGFALIKLKGKDDNSWLLVKERDDYAKGAKPEMAKASSRGADRQKEVKQEMPRGIRPMLAKRVDQPFDRSGWIFEIKYDGFRAISEISGGKAKLYSRNGLDLAARFPSVARELAAFKGEAVFDGEIVALKGGRADFHALQDSERNPARLQYVIFDVIFRDGVDYRPKTLSERKDALVGLFKKSNTILVGEYISEKGKDFFRAIKKEKLEGMVAKNMESPYLEGIRSADWLKIKNVESQEAIIIGYTAPRGSRHHLGALVLGAYRDGQLRYIGHSGGGFTESELGDLLSRLSRIKRKSSPVREKVPVNSPITWVQPKFVCEVSFSEWTPSGRMRHPVYKGLRIDKKAREVTREESIKPETALKSASGPVTITNPEKIFWPKEKITKRDLIKYYEDISGIILPYLKDRPQNLLRHPGGISGPSFFHKDINFKVPGFASLEAVWSDSNRKKIKYLLCQNKETLMYMANLGCIEINPWNSRIADLDRPDYMIMDLDPGSRKFEDLIIVARTVHRILEDACEESYIKTSGKSGLHICIPLGAKYTYDQIKPLILMIARLVNRALPEITSLERSPAKRQGKIYLDYLQNRRGQTLAAPYSVRPVPGATVSTPLDWREIKKGLDPRAFTIRTIFKRLEKKGDLWAPVIRTGIDIEESLRCLEKSLRARPGRHHLP